jgi:hypothetical protein
MRHSLPAEIEEHRDRHWQRESTGCVQTLIQAERFVERTGFSACLTDARQPGPSLYVAVCGRRDAVMPRNMQKDPESSLSWRLKDEMLRHGRVYYGKLARGKSMLLAPSMIPHFRAIWGISRQQESKRLTIPARTVLRALRQEWEMGTAELRAQSRISDRKKFANALDELQAAMIVVPTEVLYEPKFTYLWGLVEERFEKQTATKVDLETARREIARCFLAGAGMTIPGELARVTGMSRPEAGLGNRALVKEGYAVMIAPGTYRLARLPNSGN